MYQILYNNHILYSPKHGISLIDPKLNLKVNTAGVLEFSVPPTHYLHGNIKKIDGKISIFQNKNWLWSGRVFNTSLDSDNILFCECEGELGYLNDTVQRPKEYHNVGIRDYLADLLRIHNEQTDAPRHFETGIVTAGGSALIDTASDYDNSLSCIMDKLVALYGGYIFLRHSGGKTYIDYLEDFNNINTQHITYGDNLVDLVNEAKSENLATVIIPLGKKDQDTEKYTTVASVNEGSDSIRDADAVKEYGEICKVVIHDDITDPAALLQKGYEDLEASKYIKGTIEVTAIDKYLIDDSVESFKVGDLITADSKPHSLSAQIMVQELEILPESPESTKVTLGLSYATLTDSKLHADKVINEIKADYVKNELLSNSLETVNQRIEYNTSLIDQTANNIFQLVEQTYVKSGDFESYKSTSQEQTAEQIEFIFKQASDKISDIEDHFNGKHELLEEYIRFKGALIELGRVGNDFTAELDNEQLRFKQSGNTIAYISNNKLYITDAQVKQSLHIGGFSFLPRSNGNMSIKYTGG